MTDADQPQSHSEQTDPAKLGETVGQHDRPADLLDPSDDHDLLDDEEQLVAAEGDEVDSAAEVAVHEIPREQQR